MNNLRFTKQNKTFYIFYLFCSSLLSSEVNAFLPVLYDETQIEKFSICLIISFGFNCVCYFLSKLERITNSKSFVDILLFDYWFDDSILRKFVSLIYFISLTIFWALIIFYLYELINTQSPIFLGYLLISPVLLILTRCLLESIISVIKIAENTKPKKDLSNKNESSKLDSR
tara:strand:+ start:207 stop:722 length:516 start_codon:yes stop_codon:yes gene_type:complete